MLISHIPPWNERGLLPPVRPGQNLLGEYRSPYSVGLREFRDKFSTSVHRQKLLQGLLNLRRDLKAAGIAKGFQWINGSFTEEVERTEMRPPNDIDVVTFFPFGNEEHQRRLFPKIEDLVDSSLSMQKYGIEHYVENLDSDIDELIGRCLYWYSVWSHRPEPRDSASSGTIFWKGFVRLDLQDDEDEAADLLEEQGGRS